MKKILAFTLVSALMTGCGGGSDGDDQNTNNPGSGSGTDSSQGGNDHGSGASNGEPTVLEGTWRKPCGPVPGEEHHDIVTFTSTGNEFTSSIENYTDANCTNPHPDAPNPTSLGTFTLGDDVLLSDGVTATEFDSHITHFDGAPFIVDDYNIVYIQGDTLYIGVEGGETPAQRPTSLDYDQPYYRVN
ncbi:hypothetical protein [Marinobacter zhejiangensis]|uniref:Uncharacterized protein n=1 Tax=Marinobacter zhejiangensis TaxID=488535 RepID=A0A1I4PXR0_9GAMM|nr:hypothetical protein [Marinobacter zhejiangensis]SFM32598.1 hypothetical protein SAMN04487963_2059 [Marinobacter zhejiangensis]